MSCVVHTLAVMPECDGWAVVGRGHLVVPHGEISVLVVQDSTGVLRAVYWDRQTRCMVAPEVDAVATDAAGRERVWERRVPPPPPV